MIARLLPWFRHDEGLSLPTPVAAAPIWTPCSAERQKRGQMMHSYRVFEFNVLKFAVSRPIHCPIDSFARDSAFGSTPL